MTPTKSSPNLGSSRSPATQPEVNKPKVNESKVNEPESSVVTDSIAEVPSQMRLSAAGSMIIAFHHDKQLFKNPDNDNYYLETDDEIYTFLENGHVYVQDKKDPTNISKLPN